MKKMDPLKLLRNLVVEIIIYSLLIFGYYMLVLRFLGEWIFSIFHTNLILYAFAGLGLIFVQAVILDLLTSFLMKFIKLDQFGSRRIRDVFSDR